MLLHLYYQRRRLHTLNEFVVSLTQRMYYYFRDKRRNHEVVRLEHYD